MRAMESSSASVSPAMTESEAAGLAQQVARDTASPQPASGPLKDFLAAQSPMALALAAGGFAVSAAGTIAAMATGANAALALLLGYSSLAGTAALAIALRRPAPVATPEAPASEPVVAETSPAWKLVSTLTVSDASRLWCGIEPGAMATQDSMAWGRALIDAIKRGELAIVRKAGLGDEAFERERANPHYMIQLERDALKAWAAQHGHAPAFLRD
jgi:hypothetical protein